MCFQVRLLSVSQCQWWRGPIMALLLGYKPMRMMSKWTRLFLMLLLLSLSPSLQHFYSCVYSMDVCGMCLSVCCMCMWAHGCMCVQCISVFDLWVRFLEHEHFHGFTFNLLMSYFFVFSHIYCCVRYCIGGHFRALIVMWCIGSCSAWPSLKDVSSIFFYFLLFIAGHFLLRSGTVTATTGQWWQLRFNWQIPPGPLRASSGAPWQTGRCSPSSTPSVYPRVCLLSSGPNHLNYLL